MFPYKSFKGNQYLMIILESDNNAIIYQPVRSKESGDNDESSVKETHAEAFASMVHDMHEVNKRDLTGPDFSNEKDWKQTVFEVGEDVRQECNHMLALLCLGVT